MSSHFARTAAVACFVLVASGCGQDADKAFAGMSSVVVGQLDGVGYRLRYLDPPWERAASDPLEQDAPEARVQFGQRDRSVGPVSLPDLIPSPGSSRVLEIERPAQATSPTAGVVTYPKYRLEVSVLRCDQLGIQVAQQDSCAKQLNASDLADRTGHELNTFFGEGGRTGTNERGQLYYEFMTRVMETSRYRRVVYYETAQRLVAVRLGFEANAALSELEVTQMVDAFEVLEGEFAEPEDAGVAGDAGSP